MVIDPYDPQKLGVKLPKLETDVVLSSHNHFDHNYIEGVSGYRLVIDNPGEYEVSGVFIHGIETYHDDKEGKERGKNTMFLIEIDGFTLLHAGDLGHELSKDTLEKISEVDVLMIPVGGVYTIDAETASEVISSLEPSIVIPMHYKYNGVSQKLTKDESKVDIKLATVEEFLEEMGVENTAKKEDKLKISNKSDIPEETQVVVLNPQN